MKSLLIILALCVSACAQTTVSGDVSVQGGVVIGGTSPPNTSPAFPVSALLNWCTSIACTPSPGSTVTIGDTGGTALCPTTCNFTSSQLSTAINSLSCGQTLAMENQALPYAVGTLKISQNCDAAHWITIERDPNDATFPTEGTKVDPCYMGIPQNKMPYHVPYPLADLTPNTCARHMPNLQKTSVGSSILITGSFIRFVGLEWSRSNSYDLDSALVSMNNAAACTAPDNACIALQANHIIFDRNELHGDAQRQTTRAIGLGGVEWAAVIESDIYDIGATFAGGDSDAQTMSWGFGKNLTNVGWGKFINNSLSASTMCFLTGGADVEPVSLLTGFDGIPHDVWFSQDWCFKNPLWDTQIGQTQQLAQTIEGTNYGPAPDQEFTQVPSTIQVAVGQTYAVQTWTAHDSRAGINRSPSDVATATNTLNGVASTCNVQTANGFVCTVFGNVGSGIHQSMNQFVSTYTPPTSVPAGPVTYQRCFTTNADGLAGTTLGNNRQLCASTVFTIVASNPTHAMVVGPSAPDIQIQPSYSDAFGNSRIFALQFNAIPNFTSASTTWDVDGVVGGNSTVGTIDSAGLYTSPATTGSHTIHAVASDGTTGSSAIAISNSAPIVETDGRAYTSKNGWELKEGSRVLFENSLLTLAFGSQGNGGGQGGQFMLAHPLNQNGCPQNCLDGNGVNVGYGPQFLNDFTARYLEGSYFGAAFVVGGASESQGTHRVSISNIVCIDCSRTHWSHGFSNSYFATQANTGPATVYTWESTSNTMQDNVVYRHITMVGDVPNTFGENGSVNQPKGNNYVMQDSFFASPNSTTFLNPNGGTGNCNTAGGSGVNNTEALSLVPCFASYTFNHLALLDSTAAPSVFLSSPIWQPASTAVGFVNFNGGIGGDYRLCKGLNNPASPCAAASIFAAGQADQASDGTDLGADMVGINAVDALVRAGIRTP